jgi:hypothetical protein
MTAKNQTQPAARGFEGERATAFLAGYEAGKRDEAPIMPTGGLMGAYLAGYRDALTTVYLIQHLESGAFRLFEVSRYPVALEGGRKSERGVSYLVAMSAYLDAGDVTNGSDEDLLAIPRTRMLAPRAWDGPGEAGQVMCEL